MADNTYNPNKWDIPQTKKAEANTYDPDEWDIAGAGKVKPEVEEPKSTTGVVLEELKNYPKTLAAYMISLAQGGKGASVADRGFLDKFYDKTMDEQATRQAENEEGGGKFAFGLTDANVSSAIQNSPFTVGGLAGAIGGGAITAPIPVPGARIAGSLGGSWLMTHGASAYAAMNRNLKKYDAINMEETGRHITLDEENAFKELYGTDINKIADWDAGTEMLSALAEVAIYQLGGKYIPAPMRAKASKMVLGLVKNKLARAGAGNVAKLAGTLITETAEEVVANIGGGNVEKGIWGEEKEKWDVPTALRTAKEVLPEVALLSGGIHAGGTAAGLLQKRKGKPAPTFTDQLPVLSDELNKSKNKAVDLNTIVDLRSQLADDAEKQTAIDDVIVQATSTGLQDGTLKIDDINKILNQLVKEDPLYTVLSPMVKATEVAIHRPPKTQQQPTATQQQLTGAGTVLERMQKGAVIPEETKLTNAKRMQKRIDAIAKRKPSDVVGDYFKDITTMSETEDQQTAEKVEVDKQEQVRKLLPILKKLQSKKELTKLELDLINQIETADTEERGGRVAPERGRVEPVEVEQVEPIIPDKDIASKQNVEPYSNLPAAQKVALDNAISVKDLSGNKTGWTFVEGTSLQGQPTGTYSIVNKKLDEVRFFKSKDVGISTENKRAEIKAKDYAIANRTIESIVQKTEVKTKPPATSPNAEAKEILNDVNPTGGIFTEYSPDKIAKMKLGKNITTLDKTSNKKADDIVTVYRGAPKKQVEIVSGDFITTNKQLAKDYAGTGIVLEKDVKMSDVLDDSTDPLGEEYIYKPTAKAKQAEPVVPEIPKTEADEIFIRLATKKETRSDMAERDAFLSIPDKAGFEKVYKPYGAEGKGFYYKRLSPATTEPVVPEIPTSPDKVEAERQDIDGFGDDLSPMQKGRVVKVLNKKVRLKGVPTTTLKDLIRKKVADGNILNETGEILGKPDDHGQYHTVIGYNVGKIGGKYAQHLINKKSPTVKTKSYPASAVKTATAALKANPKDAASILKELDKAQKMSDENAQEAIDRIDGEIEKLQKVLDCI